ncbi:MAG: flagella synthesis protein FlgN [Flavobacteriales bacterium]|jgi:flagella synthesis protein FlgN
MSLPFTADQLNEHIVQNIATCHSLMALLHKEQEALQNRDADVIESIIKSKIPLLETLEHSARLRSEWTQRAQQAPGQEGWNSLLDELAHSDIRNLWRQLTDLYQKTREQNEINGKLLSRHQKTVGRVLDVMRGRTSAPTLYTAAGASSSYANTTRMGEA